MLVPNQYVGVVWTHNNREHYEQKGYKFTQYKSSIMVKAEDLSSGSKIQVLVNCDFCKKEYKMTWQKCIGVINKNEKHACCNCRNAKRHEKTLMQRQENLYYKAIQACEEKGYILLSAKEEIQNNNTYIKYICPIHGVHIMRINNLINGKGCPDCVYDYQREKYQLSPDEVECRIMDCGGILTNKEDYVNQTTKNLLVICPECGKLFTTSLRNFTQHEGQVCDDCSNNESIGVKRIRHYLENHNIIFNREKWFPNCRDINPLPFDFYIESLNTIVEFDGRQHFEETGYFSYPLEQTQKHDKIKNEYCERNNIKLIRIPYWKINKINSILDQELISHEDIV